ncbi:hypothetical protein JI664_22255 [Rhodobacter sp. NTK016B]|uniref:hypothetical protein n=1 Tax=Rhodobacter sp. NTK016B TaxID=2759676 RepID=UPI001A8F1A9C|nr:hypothetical protein [Rhodobacter sp. NTK016B]MBN8294710.1 hypothetical protein [Rhodobacter sp. NTK016B]
MKTPCRWTQAEMLQLASSAVHKVDLLGERGATLVTCDEVCALTALVALHVPLANINHISETLKGNTDV